MARARTKHNHPYMQLLLDQTQTGTIKELAEKLNLPEQTVRNWADSEGTHRQFEAARKAATALGVSMDEFISGLLQPRTV